MRFDGNGIRDVSELKVLQYRYNVMNFSLTLNEEVYNSSHNVASERKLRLIEVATVRNNSLVFLAGNKDNIWPGNYYFYSVMMSNFCALCSILGYTPIDGVPKIGITSINLAVTTTFIPLHICGVVFALFCLAFNIINRKKRLKQKYLADYEFY